MIEVQLILSGKENPDYLAQCKEGLQSPYVNIHEGEWIEDKLVAARVAVWERCGGDLLSFVDPEDIPNPKAWEKLQKVFDDQPEALAAYTLEETVNDVGTTQSVIWPNTQLDPIDQTLFPRHILVVRRKLFEVVKPYALSFNSGLPRFLASAAFSRGALIQLQEFLYKDRRHYPNFNTRDKITPKQAKDFKRWINAQTL